MDAPPQLPPVPAPASGRRAVEGVLRVTRRSCLERTLVMQAWHSAAGSDRDIVVGVRGPTDRFEAHAWLDGEDPGDFAELTRYPAGRAGGPASSQAGEGEPRTTVVIAAWDEPYVELLQDAVASVRSQAREARVVVVDNASATPLPSIEDVAVVSSAERLSRGAARNLGLRHVTTEFVLFLDADDLLLDGSLARLESQLDALPECAACGMSILEGEVGTAEPAGRHSVPRPFVPRLSRLRRTFALADAVWPLYSTQGATLIRTGSVSAHAYDDTDGGEDWVLGLSLALRGVRILEEPGLIYRRHPAASGWADPRSSGYLPKGAAGVRQRLRDDPAAPAWMRMAIPAIGLGQLLLLRVLWPLKVRLGPAPRGERGR